MIVVHVERAYFQCPKALVRSDLWNPAKHVERRSLPSSGAILADITRGRVGGPEYDAAYPERLCSLALDEPATDFTDECNATYGWEEFERASALPWRPMLSVIPP